jgi:tetratricopeptide (TPR) repeat protein
VLAAITIVFAVRAVSGTIAGLSYSKGRALATIGQQEERALAYLERAEVGELAPIAHWLESGVRMELWQESIEGGAEPEEVTALLSTALEDAGAALASSPASGWYWMALGNLYHQAERLSRHRQGVPLKVLDQDRWSYVGRPGRVAIGLMRIALTREPNWYTFHDQLAYVYYDYRMQPETLDAVYRSALTLPVYELHPYRTLRPPDPEIVDAFARGAVDSLGKVPWLRPVLHRIALGRLEVRRENWIDAETHLRIALSEATIALNVAEIHYNLGLSLIGQERFDEARDSLTIAESQSPIEPYAVVARADLAARLADWTEATNLLLRARRLAPDRLDVSLKLARAAQHAGQTDLAVFTLREASRRHPDNREPRIELARLFIDEGNEPKAREVLADLERLAPQHPSVQQIRLRLAPRSAELD